MYSTVSQSTEDAGYAFFHYHNLYPPPPLNPNLPRYVFVPIPWTPLIMQQTLIAMLIQPATLSHART